MEADAATQGRRATEDSGGVDQGGRLARASAAALGTEPQPRRKAIVSAAAPGAVMVVNKQDSYLEDDVGSGGIRSANPRLTLQLREGHFYIRAGIRTSRSEREREAVAPADSLFGTRLFVCAKNWVLGCSRSLNELSEREAAAPENQMFGTHKRSLNELKGPCSGCC